MLWQHQPLVTSVCELLWSKSKGVVFDCQRSKCFGGRPSAQQAMHVRTKGPGMGIDVERCGQQDLKCVVQVQIRAKNEQACV